MIANPFYLNLIRGLMKGTYKKQKQRHSKNLNIKTNNKITKPKSTKSIIANIVPKNASIFCQARLEYRTSWYEMMPSLIQIEVPTHHSSLYTATNKKGRHSLLQCINRTSTKFQCREETEKVSLASNNQTNELAFISIR